MGKISTHFNTVTLQLNKILQILINLAQDPVKAFVVYCFHLSTSRSSVFMF